MAMYYYPKQMMVGDGTDRGILIFFNKETTDFIFTYMPTSMTFQDGASYGTIDGGILGTVVNNAVSKGSSMEDGMAAGKSAATAAQQGGGGAVAAIIAGMGQSTGIDPGVAGFVAASNGKAMNPNTVAQFTNNNIRTYAFEIQMVPESADEAIEIRNIIKAFKLSLYATEQDQFLLGYPDKWTIYFSAAALPKGTGELYLTDMTTTYNTEGAMNHQDQNFNSVNISLNFQETKALHRGDIEKLEK